MQAYPKYSSWQIFVHWLTALCVITAIVLPLLRNVLAEPLGGMANLFMIHKSLGALIFFITLWRIILIIKKGIPEVLPKHEKLQRIVSKLVQGIIYILLLVLPLSGYLMSARAINIFGLLTINGIELPENLHLLAHSVHIISAYLIIALVLLHIAGALYHHYWVKDNVLKAMLPGKY